MVFGTEFAGGVSMNESTFRLSFIEGFESGECLCTALGKVELTDLGHLGKVGLKVAISPPIEAGRYSRSTTEHLVLTAYFWDDTLFPIGRWPFSVRVFAPTVDCPETKDHFEKDELYMIAFGELLPSGMET